MSTISKNTFGTLLVGAVLFGALIAPGCSSDDQATPTGGAGATAHAGSGNAGKASTAGSAGKTSNDSAGAGDTGPGDQGGDTGAGGDNGAGAGGEGGAAPVTVDCDQSFDNSTLTAISDNGGELPPLP